MQFAEKSKIISKNRANLIYLKNDLPDLPGLRGTNIGYLLVIIRLWAVWFAWMDSHKMQFCFEKKNAVC